MKARRALSPLLAFVALVLVWESASRILRIEKILLPRPHEVVLAARAHGPQLLEATGTTMIEAVFGFVLGSAAAYLLAILFVHSPVAKEALYPYAVALKSTPLIAIAPLLVLWFGNGLLSKVVMAALVAFFPVLVTSVSGLGDVDPDTMNLMRSLSASRWQVFIKIRVPSSLPHVFAGLKVATSLSVVGAIIGEFTGSTAGVGHLINTSSYYLETPLMFAGIVAISICGIVFFGLIAFLEGGYPPIPPILRGWRGLIFWRAPL